MSDASLGADITGLGIVSSLARGADANFSALLAGECINDHTPCDGFAGPDRIVALAREAAQEAIAHARWDQATVRDPSTAIVFATSKGDVARWLEEYPKQAGLARVDVELAESLQIGGIHLTISAACAGGLHAVARAIMALRTGEAQRVLVVAAEASIHPMFIGAFNQLGVLPPAGWGCRPFDVTRKGFLMGEGAAALCLEIPRENAGGGAGNHNSHRPLARICKVIMGSDATHITGIDPSGKTLRRLVRHCVEDCDPARQIDLVHAHGTGTELNDPVELSALSAEIRQPNSPIVYSHKAALGHTLGCASVLATAINALAHQRGMVPGNVRTHQQLDATGVLIPQATSRANIRTSLVIANGFGSAMAVARLES